MCLLQLCLLELNRLARAPARLAFFPPHSINPLHKQASRLFVSCPQGRLRLPPRPNSSYAVVRRKRGTSRDASASG